MRMNTGLIAGLALAVMPVVAASEQFIVLLDNSASVKGGDTYLADIADIMSVAGRNHYLFAPIGAADDDAAGAPVAVGSKDGDREQALRSLFDFKDVHTRIDASLARIESRPDFADTDEVVIVSDMDPDSQLFRGSEWCFNDADIDDLIATNARLERWLEQGKRITIALHQWDRKSTAYFSDDELRRIHEHLTRRRAEIAERTVCDTPGRAQGNPNTANRERAENRRLVEKVVKSLEVRYPTQVTLKNIPQNQPEQFLGLLCGRLNVNDIDQQVCVVPEKKEFKVLIGFNNRLSVGQSQAEWFRRELPEEVYVPQKRLIPKEQLEVLTRSPSRDEAGRYDYSFAVEPGSQGKPFYRPTIYSLVRRANGRVEMKENVVTEHDNPDHLAMMDWALTRITELLGNYIDDDFPVSKPLKRIKVAKLGRDGKPQPIPRGYVFLVQTQYPEIEPIASRTSTPDGNGLLKFRIPRSEGAKNSLLLRLAEDNSILMAEIPADRIEGRKTINIGIRPEYFSPVSIDFAPPTAADSISPDGAQGQALQVQLATYLKGADEYEVHTEQLGIPGQARLELLPGTYRIEVTPVDRPDLRAIIQENLLVSSDRQQEPIPFTLERDSLYRGIDDPIPDTWLGLSEDWIGLGRLNNDALTAIGSSAYVLTALLRYSSIALADGAGDELTNLWRLLRAELFNEERQTKQRQLQRALDELFFTDDVDASTCYLHAEAMFDQFIDARSPGFSGTTGEQKMLQLRYKAWLDRIADRTAEHDRLLSKPLAERLKATD
jgi:hypothetical protein